MRQTILPILAAILPFVANAAADPNAGIPEDCPELRVNLVSVPDDQNAHAILAKLPRNLAKSSVEHPESFYDLDLFWKLRSKTEKPTGIIIGKAKVLLTRHAESIRLWDAALSAPKFVEPTVNSYDETYTLTSGNNFSANREAVFGNIWRIRVATFEGRHADAFNDWLRLRSALVRQAVQPGTLLAAMIRSVELGVVNKEAWMLQPTLADARRCRPHPVKFPTAAYKGTIRSETRFSVVVTPETDEEISKFIETSFNGLKEKEIHTVAEYRTKVQPLVGDRTTRAHEACAEIRRMEKGDLGDPLAHKKKLAEDSPYSRRDKAAGAYLGDTKIFDFIYFGAWADAISCTQADLAIALRAYAGEHEGKLPPTLDALVPTYADAVPLDPFDGKPMRYDPKIPKLWSIGPDFTDDQAPLMMNTTPRRSDMTGDITSYPPNIVPALMPAAETSK